VDEDLWRAKWAQMPDYPWRGARLRYALVSAICALTNNYPSSISRATLVQVMVETGINEQTASNMLSLCTKESWLQRHGKKGAYHYTITGVLADWLQGFPDSSWLLAHPMGDKAPRPRKDENDRRMEQLAKFGKGDLGGD
jgi:hypothetical protein